MKADGATISVELNAQTQAVAEQAIAKANEALAHAAKALAQRDEARLRVNLMCMAMGIGGEYPVPEVHADLVRAVSKALEPVR